MRELTTNRTLVTRIAAYLFLGLGLGAGVQPAFAQLEVVSVTPVAQTVGASLAGPIGVTFDRPLDRLSVTSQSFWAFGRWSGAVSGSFAFSNGDRTVSLLPDQPFFAGETVLVILARDLQASDGSFLRQGGYSFQFWTRAAAGSLDFVETQRLSTRTDQGTTSRAYGGFASDLNGDRYADVTIVNEDTNDLRVFLNQADGGATFDDFLLPTYPTGSVPSPSEPGDFDRDGFTDVAVANTVGSSVSILLGQGDGTFGTQQAVALNAQSRGIAVLDADGDGDLDVAATAYGTDRVALLLNDGTGTFGAPTYFGTGTAGEWALGAADMDNDGLLDLVVGGRDAQQIYVYRNDGDGTFTAIETQSSGGAVWMIALGDVNNDGLADVVGVNSSNNNGAVLLGTGGGQLALPQLTATDSFPLATDLGDLDGDNDLDWISSSFSGDWQVFLNGGSGDFTFLTEFDAPQAASCSLAVDVDNDLVLDLVLVDELADVFVVMRQESSLFRDGFESGDLSAWSAAAP